MNTYDTIVIGLGGMGSATVCELARRGHRVLGLEQYAFDHTLGSSHGQSRIIRQAYFEHPDYVPLLQAAYEGWDALSAGSATELFNRCGLLLAGPDTGEVIAGTREAASLHQLPLEELNYDTAQRRYPAFNFREGDTILNEAQGGYLRVEACVAAHLAQARHHGATLHEMEPVSDWNRDGAGVRVTTDRAVYRAARLILCAGSWTGPLLASLALPLEVRRVVTAWFPTENPAFTLEKGCPVFAFQTPDGFYYGFPELDTRGVKLACHAPGLPVADPATVDRHVTAVDVAPLQAFARQYLQGIASAPSDSTVCLYTMSPDGHFIIDRHPEQEQVTFAAGFSGHGFKFCPAIGQILADLSITGKSELPRDFLGLKRFQ